jgi:hypothetical protein
LQFALFDCTADGHRQLQGETPMHLMSMLAHAKATADPAPQHVGIDGKAYAFSPKSVHAKRADTSYRERLLYNADRAGLGTFDGFHEDVCNDVIRKGNDSESELEADVRRRFFPHDRLPIGNLV